MVGRSWFAFLIVVCCLQTLQADQPTSVYGAWDLTLESQRGLRPSWVKLFKERDVTVAEFVGTGGGKSRASNVKVDGNKFQWMVGGAAYSATLADGKLSGHVVRDDRRTPFTGQPVIRDTNLSGTWDVEISFGDRRMERVLKLAHEGEQITGTYGGGQFPRSDLEEATVDEGKLKFRIVLSNDGREFTVNYELDVQGDQLEGVARVEGVDREGTFSAVRQRKWADPIELIGSDLSNWDFQEVGGSNEWKIDDGVLVNQARGWNIISKQKFKNYRLGIDVKVPKRGNSGIYLNGRYEVQVADSYGKGVSKGGMGAIYGRAVPAANPSKPASEWQTFEITFVDYWATVVLNGKTIVDNVLIEGITGGALDSNESEPGPLMLQGDHGPIEYRRIVITPLAE